MVTREILCIVILIISFYFSTSSKFTHPQKKIPSDRRIRDFQTRVRILSGESRVKVTSAVLSMYIYNNTHRSAAATAASLIHTRLAARVCPYVRAHEVPPAMFGTWARALYILFLLYNAFAHIFIYIFFFLHFSLLCAFCALVYKIQGIYMYIHQRRRFPMNCRDRETYRVVIFRNRKEKCPFFLVTKGCKVRCVYILI